MPKAAAEKKEKGTRKMSPYNMFMKKELAKVKVDHPTLSHKEAFKRAASNWADSSDNPKNKAK